MKEQSYSNSETKTIGWIVNLGTEWKVFEDKKLAVDFYINQDPSSRIMYDMIMYINKDLPFYLQYDRSGLDEYQTFKKDAIRLNNHIERYLANKTNQSEFVMKPGTKLTIGDDFNFQVIVYRNHNGYYAIQHNLKCVNKHAGVNKNFGPCIGGLKCDPHNIPGPIYLSKEKVSSIENWLTEFKRKYYKSIEFNFVKPYYRSYPYEFAKLLKKIEKKHKDKYREVA